MFDLNKFKTDFVFKGKPRCLSLDYNDLIKYCKSPDFDPKMFKMMHDNYAKAFNRLDWEQQGKIVETINIHHKNW